MKYSECLKEFSKIGVKEKFISEYETMEKQVLLAKLKETDKIYSAAVLIKNLMNLHRNNIEKHEYWRKVFFYLITPKFSRTKNF